MFLEKKLPCLLDMVIFLGKILQILVYRPIVLAKSIFWYIIKCSKRIKRLLFVYLLYLFKQASNLYKRIDDENCSL